MGEKKGEEEELCPNLLDKLMNRRTIVEFGWNFVMEMQTLHFLDVEHLVDRIGVDVFWALWCWWWLFWINDVHEIRSINSVHSVGPWPIAIQLLYFHLILKRDNPFDCTNCCCYCWFSFFVLLSIRIRYWHFWLGLNRVLFLLRNVRWIASFYCRL